MSEAGRRGPWPWLAAVGIAAIVAAAVVVVVTGGDDDGDEQALVEVFQQPVAEVGPDPFTEPVAPAPTANISTYATAVPPPTDGVAEVGSIDGGEPGLYGGTLEEASCDKAQLIGFLESDTDKAAAWAGVLGIETDAIADYIGGLTAMLLPSDTRVTNHGFADDEAYPLQSVLQAGTAVLVDDRGVPRVRCYCGNPLLPPEAADEGVEYVGDTWSTFDVGNLRVIQPTAEPLDAFVLTDVDGGGRFSRPVGSDGSMDALVSAGDPGEDPPPGDEPGDALPSTGPLLAEGAFEPADVPGVAVSYTTNRLTLRFDAEGGPVTGDAQIVVAVAGATVNGSAEFTGTYDAESGRLQGSFTSQGSFGGLTAGGAGNWSAGIDTDAGLVTGSITAVGGPPAGFLLAVVAA